MHVDVVNSIVINRHVADVSQYAANPGNAPLWYVNIKSVEWKTPRPVQVAAQIDFVAQFLGRRFAYTYEIIEFIPGRHLISPQADGRRATLSASATFVTLFPVANMTMMRLRTTPRAGTVRLRDHFWSNSQSRPETLIPTLTPSTMAVLSATDDARLARADDKVRVTTTSVALNAACEAMDGPDPRRRS